MGWSSCCHQHHHRAATSARLHLLFQWGRHHRLCRVPALLKRGVRHHPNPIERVRQRRDDALWLSLANTDLIAMNWTLDPKYDVRWEWSGEVRADSKAETRTTTTTDTTTISDSYNTTDYKVNNLSDIAN